MPIKKIAFLVTRGDSIGGAQIHVRDCARELQRRNVAVTVYVGSTGALCEELDSSGISWVLLPGLVRSINPIKDLLAIFRLAGLLKRDRPQLLSTHTAKSGLVGRWAAWLAGVPSLFTAHGWQFAEGISSLQKFIVLMVERITAPLSSRIITVSKYDYELAVSNRVVKLDQLRLIHNGMPDREISPEWIKKFQPLASEPRNVNLIMVARFQEQKDHQLLLTVLNRIKDLNWSLDLVGDGPLLDSVKNTVQVMDLGDRVTFLGQRMDVPELLEKADIYVLTSHWEGFPRSILEGMRAGLPVIASDVGGVKEAVIPQETGYLIPESDGNSLEKALIALIIQGDLRRVLGANGRKRFEELFTFEIMFERTWKVYQEVGEKRE